MGLSLGVPGAKWTVRSLPWEERRAGRARRRHERSLRSRERSLRSEPSDAAAPRSGRGGVMRPDSSFAEALALRCYVEEVAAAVGVEPTATWQEYGPPSSAYVALAD